MSSAAATSARLRAGPAPTVAIDRLRLDLQIAAADYDYREAARSEQVGVYALASDPSLEQTVLRSLPAKRQAGMSQAVDAVRALWRLAGYTDVSTIRPRRTRRFAAAEPVDTLLGYYKAAAARVGIDWTYLAAINYVESGFGRNPGQSAAGALGPMQFLPSTWAQYGGGGDVMDPHDAIEGAATFLRRNGAPGDYDKALLHYNPDTNYAAAVRSFAGAIRADPSWLNRLYCWSTYG